MKLSTAQEIGLRFYDGWSLYLITFSSHPLTADINDRMPRGEAKAIFDLIKPIGIRLSNDSALECTYRYIALSIDSNLFIEIMGSYRR